MEKFTPKMIRVHLSLTQQEVAQILGISRQNYAQKENGKLEFTFEEVKKICDLAGVSLDHIEV